MADNKTCFVCHLQSDDVKVMIQCTGCSNYYHRKCIKLDLRGFHNKKSNWKCNRCDLVQGKQSEVMGIELPKTRKKSKNEEGESAISDILVLLKSIIKNNSEMTAKIDYLIQENAQLKEEILKIKNVNQQHKHGAKTEDNATYASIAKTKNVLIVKSKNESTTTQQIKDHLLKNVQPAELGTGLTMGRKIKTGGIVLNCGNDTQIQVLQDKIQSKMGDQYNVVHPTLKKKTGLSL